MDTEDFVEFRRGPVDRSQVQVINNRGERELTKIIPVQLDLLDAFAKFPYLGFLCIIEQQVLYGSDAVWPG